MDSRKQPASAALSDKDPGQGSNKSVDDATLSTSSSSAVNDNCILFGRGKGCNNHPANKRMRLVINRYRDDYQAAGRGEKKRIVLKVHKELVDEGMKFLKQEEGINGWIEADSEEAITKVGHAIRCIRRSGCKRSEADSDVQPPQAARALVPPSFAVGREASAPGQVPQDKLAGVSQEDVAASLALASSIPAVASAGFLSSDALLGGRHPQSMLGSTLLPLGSNPLLSLGSIPIHSLTGSYPSLLSTSMGLAQAQTPPPLLPSSSMAAPQQNGLSAVERYVLLERERELQQVMLYYEHMLRNHHPGGDQR